MTKGDPYGASRVLRGAIHLLLGKAVTSVAGIGTFVLLVRALPVEQFAAYTILFALVDLIDTIASVGLSHALARYVPELFGSHRTFALRRFVVHVMALRLGLLAICLLVVYALASQLGPLIGLANWEWALKAYLPVVLVRTAANSLFGILESMLHQGLAQLGFSIVTVLRFGMLWLATAQGPLDLQTVIIIELTADLLGVGIMLLATIRVMPRPDPAAAARDAGWVKSNFGRIAEFGIKGYVQHLLVLPYGTSTSRVLVGGTLASGEVALFGFAQTVADLLERYLPMRLLAGVTRPVLTARYVRDRRFKDLELAANLLFKINATVVCAAAVVIFGGGTQMLAWVTAGKYSEGSVGLLMMMSALVLLYALRTMLDQVCHVVERNGPLIWSNAFITLSVLPGIALLPTLGVYALPTANLAGLVLGLLILVHRLRIGGFDYRQDLVGLGRMLTATGIGLGAAECCRWIGGGWIATLAAGTVFFVAAFVLLRPWTAGERELVDELVRRIRIGANR